MTLDTAPTILQKIVTDKIEWVKNQKAALPLESFQQNITKSDRSFYDALSQGSHQKPAFILECKKASPSKGLIRNEFKPKEIADVYKHYASAISVLTDEKYFQGDFRYLKIVRDIVTQPVLCKDFIIDEYQVYLARYSQADAILLMLSVLDDETYLKLSALAHRLGMGVLTEAGNEAEFERALTLNAQIIGVNNRNLHDLTVDLNRVKNLVEKYAGQIPENVRIISESGIYTHQQVNMLATYAHGFLIGSSLMGSDDLNNAVRAVVFGENKVCGLTRPQDVQSAYINGALYGGLIFAEGSPRQVSLRQAQELTAAAPLRFVAVFQNQSIDFIVKIAAQLQVYAVQLHGSETDAFIADLRVALPSRIQIWKAISIDVEPENNLESAVKNTDVFSEIPYVDRYVLDSKIGNCRGGTGKSFDWRKIPARLKAKVMLAGGISLENIDAALDQQCLGLDLNSGAESGKGVKDPQKITRLFQRILQC
ncbi:bifunctional indole-3-glycerol phosphate synthase/phosphoribosylanthranilate isomerase [Actinobacillus succinogenes]|uniref:Multifunctional fusion protein n=1 Tax=Actinobacillus succinogenes (strain ATCC 55618 / DSM 22257 / CCUG 43843 / 130Z) TaxID=339671 RepID=A6VNT2_ACTSZ|nr:bifunctional indole-3-glycerol-phosphate synthase TrpC/phosphoribosylanthranilate isomerase TrpF [Actinobacillus succinogenes]ABR74629.1 Indole-3-glycerol-phosphate synthase, Phosphoribosylanthranilate isomerase [Actinobacillus succinogenes 130Z]PHI40946.1 bifunctional indole-3-glycerol phosphate synthase/phosphoribosylanthranilate isomerase [Actinobacillus succinogenes]